MATPSAFFAARSHPAPAMAQHSWLQRTFWPTWFAMDDVRLSPDHVPFLQRKFEQVQLDESSQGEDDDDLVLKLARTVGEELEMVESLGAPDRSETPQEATDYKMAMWDTQHDGEIEKRPEGVTELERAWDLWSYTMILWNDKEMEIERHECERWYGESPVPEDEIKEE